MSEAGMTIPYKLGDQIIYLQNFGNIYIYGVIVAFSVKRDAAFIRWEEGMVALYYFDESEFWIGVARLCQ
jgi:hypothetical protein